MDGLRARSGNDNPRSAAKTMMSPQTADADLYLMRGLPFERTRDSPFRCFGRLPPRIRGARFIPSQRDLDQRGNIAAVRRYAAIQLVSAPERLARHLHQRGGIFSIDGRRNPNAAFRLFA
jgi:hypothetical protein